MFEAILNGEMESYLGYEPNSREEKKTTNRRNGYFDKTFKTSMGETAIEVPRDCQASFESVILPKHKRDVSDIENKVLAMYARGMSQRDISATINDSPQNGRNIAISEWQTDSSFVDYALFVGTKMVATIEAKASYKDVSAVIDCQCKEYSRTLRGVDEFGNWCGFKVPFIFATNGRPYNRQLETKSGIWFLDLRKPDNAPKALRGRLSPIGITELLERDISAGNDKLQSLLFDLLRDDDGLNLRDYQIKAVQAVEKAVLDGRKNILVAMATGTGKTLTVLGMIYRFLKAERFRRILFLVDRNSLGEQAQDVFATVKLEDLLPLDKIYNVNKLGDKTFGKETRLQVATVQSMVKRILYGEDFIPCVTDYDLIIVDEAHRACRRRNFFQRPERLSKQISRRH